MEKNYEEFANAIILQAVKDYRVALSALKQNPRNTSVGRDKHDCEKFFQGDWFSVLTTLDGKRLMQQLQQEVSI